MSVNKSVPWLQKTTDLTRNKKGELVLPGSDVQLQKPRPHCSAFLSEKEELERVYYQQVLMLMNFNSRSNKRDTRISKKKRTFFLRLLMHTSGCCATVTVMLNPQRVLMMRMNGGQRAAGGITRVDADPEMESTVLRRVRR